MERAADPGQVYVAGLTGDLRPSRAWLDRAPAGPSSSAWRIAIEAQRWHADPPEGQIAAPDALRALGLGPTDVALYYAATECGRAAMLACDLAALEAYAELLPPGSLLHAWASLARGETGDAAAFAERAQRSELAPARIEAACVRALAHASRAELADARTLARRASRMARTEDIPQSQYLSNLVLARIRRLEGAPHFALRIVNALAAVASPPWWPRLAWEQALGGRRPSLAHPDAEAWSELLGAAANGDPLAFESARGRLQTVASRWPSRVAQLDQALAVLDPRGPVSALPPTLRGFCEGRSHAIPPAVSGLCTAAEAGPAGVFVCVTPDGLARRVAGLAAPLAKTVLGVAHEPLKPGRTQLAISVLAAAGREGLARDELFRRIYGFAFDFELHDGLYRTLLHRMRKWLGARGQIETQGEALALTLAEPLLLADPRCEESLEDRMLRYLARAQHQSARDAAKELGVPLRTAQTALQSLTESGAVEGRRVGRRIEYRVEDTTFSEPTRWR